MSRTVLYTDRNRSRKSWKRSELQSTGTCTVPIHSYSDWVIGQSPERRDTSRRDRYASRANHTSRPRDYPQWRRKISALGGPSSLTSKSLNCVNVTMSLNTACYPSYPSSHMVTCLIEPWPRQLDRKLDSYLAGYSTATRQDSSTATQQLLDRPRHVDRTPLTACAWASRCQARQLETGSTARQTRLTDLNRAQTLTPRRMQSGSTGGSRLDSYSTAYSTAT